MYGSILHKIKNFRANDKGVTMLEYGIIAALIAAVCIAAVVTLGTDINLAFGKLTAQLPNK